MNKPGIIVALLACVALVSEAIAVAAPLEVQVPALCVVASAQVAAGASGAEAVPAAPRRVLCSFDVYTPQEQRFIFLDMGSGKPSWAQARVTDLDARVVYAFAIPQDVPGANCAIRVKNSFAISVAPDKGGVPGEFHEELNSIRLYGREVYNEEDEWDYDIDLTPYLRNNPSRTVYVAIADSSPRDGWGAWITHVEVAVLDDGERQRLAFRKRQLEAFIQEQRSRCVLYFWADGGRAEAPYLYDGAASTVSRQARVVAGTGYVVFHLPLSDPDQAKRIKMLLHGDYLVSLAPQVADKPGEFRHVALARGMDKPDEVTNDTNWVFLSVDIPPTVAASGGCFLKIADGAPDKAPGASVMDIGVFR